MAVPYTISRMTDPTIRSSFYFIVKESATLVAIDPPREWPTRTIFFYGNFPITYFKTVTVSLIKDWIEKS